MRYTHYLSLSNTYYYYNILRRSSEELVLPGSPSAIPPATPRSRTRCAKYTTSYNADRCPSSRMLFSCQRLFLRHLSGSLWQFPTTALDDKDKHWHIVPNHSATAREKWRSYSSAELRSNVALSHWRDGHALYTWRRTFGPELLATRLWLQATWVCYNDSVSARGCCCVVFLAQDGATDTVCDMIFTIFHTYININQNNHTHTHKHT